MEMAKLYDKLNLLFLLLFVGNLCCEASDDKAYNLCMANDLMVSPQLKDTGFIRVRPNRIVPESEVQCKILFSLCKACRLWLHFKKSNLVNNHRCYPHISSHCYQGCVYLRVVDEIYNSSHAFLFLPDDEFTSVSNTVSVTLCNTLRTDLRFEVKFRVESKIQKINPTRTTTFKSPGFPSGYAVNGEEFMYEIIKPPDVQDMLVTFSDWIMSPMSKLVVYNAKTSLTFSGNSSRPIFASSSSIQVTFNTGSKHNFHSSYIVRGFKAVIICRSPFHISKPLPNSMCGPSVIRMNYGGILKFNPRENRNYDCVWVILIHPQFKLVAVQLESFRTRLSSTVEFYEGLTSEGRLIRTVYPGQRFASQNPNGFYIRLKGQMDIGDLFAVAYSSSIPAVETCPYAFKCKNGFCIQLTLKCDGINHCLDKSDETECYNDDKGIPTESIASNWSVSIIIPVVITIFIFIILCLFFIFVRRFRKISRGSVPHRQTRIASVSGNVSQQYLQNHFSMNLTLEEIDAPPSYEEVMNTPPPRGNWNLAFNWSQQELRDTTAPPPYSEYMRENEVNIYNSIDNDISDLSTIPTDTSSSNNCTDPTSEDQNSISGSGSDTVYSENIYATICETPTNSLDRWMVDRSTSTPEQGMELDTDNNKIAAGEPVMRTQVVHELNTETPSLRKNTGEDPHQSDRNNCNFTLSGADSNKPSPALEELDPIAKEEPKNNNIRCQHLSSDRQFVRASRSRSMDSESNISLDFPHCGQNAVQNPENKNGSFVRRNSYPSVIFLTDRQLNSEVFV